jgi:DNA polymerase-3 subunit alpha
MSKNFKDLTIFGPHNHPLSLDSGNTVEGFLRSAAVDFGRKAIAVTDHGTLGAIIEAHDFSQKLLKKNIDIKVVPGIELYLMPEPFDDTAGFNKDGTPKFNYYHLTVHLDDFDAYLDACKLSRSAFDKAVWKGGELKPMTTFEELRSLSGKITIFSGCMVSPVMKPILKGRQDVAERYFQELMAIAGPGRMFIEILPYEVSKNWNRQTKTFEPIKNECIPDGHLQIACNKWGFYLSEKYNIPLVISEDAHYAHESEKPIQDLRLNKDGQDNWKMSDANCLHHTDWLYQELNRLHPEYINESKFLEMVDNGWKSFENFKSFSPKFKHALPKIDIPHSCGEHCTKHNNPDDAMVGYIVNKIIQKNKFDIKDPVYMNRLKQEIDALAYNGKINILPYFLVLEEIVDWCAANDVLVGPGRGSAAGSLLTFGLGITSVDPIKEGLSFERFFDVSRVEEGLADIDTDFSNKNKVVEFVKNRWGDKFAFLGTGTTFKTKSALKDIDRLLYGSVREETDRICKLIPQSPQGVNEEDFLRGYKDADGNWQEGELHKNMELRAYLENNVQSAAMLFKMVGLIRQMGRHAAGVLIADRPIHEFIPVMKISDEITTQLLPKWVEKCGGVKYDLLGLNTLEDIRICLKNIEKRHGLKLDPWNLPDDPKIWEAAARDPETVFQLHTETVRPGLRMMKPRSVQESAILTAVFRPGAMDAPSVEDPQVTMDKIFLNRWTGAARTWYIHQDLEPILGNTKGVIVFQEQIMEIAHKLGGLTMPETQKLRKAISKKASDDLIILLNKVQDNLVANRGWTEKQAEAVCDQMKASGKYAFNKAHSVSYMYVARACAYFKYYYPLEWWAAVLTNASKDDLKKYWPKISSFTRLPDINQSTEEFRIVDGDDSQPYLLSPLNMIEGVGPAAYNEIIAKRPFINFEDFLSKVDRRVVNKRVAFKLILSGCLDQYFGPKVTDLEKLQEYMALKAKLEGKKVPEAIPDEFRQITALKRELIRKSVFKIYSGDLLEAATPTMLLNNMAEWSDSRKQLLYVKNRKIPIVDINGYNARMDNFADDIFAVVAFVAETKEVRYSNNTKTMMKFVLEIEDHRIEAVKWPEWKKTHHGIDFSPDESACLLIMKKRSGSDQVSILEAFKIEEIV